VEGSGKNPGGEEMGSSKRHKAGPVEASKGSRLEISTRKWARGAVPGNEEGWQRLIERAPYIFFALSHGDRRIVWLNSVFEQITGWSRDEWIGRSIKALIRPQDLPTAEQGFQEALNEKSQVTFELGLIDSSGEYILVEIVAVGDMRDESAIFGFARDIGKRKQVEEAMRESEERFQAMFEFAPDGYYLSDSKGTLIDVNRAAEGIIGYKKGELIGKNFLELNILPPKQIPMVIELLQGNMQGGPIGPDEFSLTRRDGTEVQVEMSTLSVMIRGKTLMLSIARDITKRKRAEQALKERERELETKTGMLEEANVALKVLLRKGEEDRTELEETVVSNVKELVEPYLEKLKKGGLDRRHMAYANIIESNLNDIISPLCHALSSRYLNFTAAEIQVANLVTQGKTTKEIADILNLSSSTIGFHRANIRKKMRIKNKRANLRSHLLSIK
jgi:PAS domain S-box-containing protein